MNAQQMADQVKLQLRDARENVWTRFPLSDDYPGFRTAPVAAQNLLQQFDGPWLVMRDPSLRAMREAVLRADSTLIIPNRSGDSLIRIPSDALGSRQGGRSPVLRIDPAPPGSESYMGPVQAVVAGCLAFDPMRRRVYGLDCHTEYLLGELRDGLPSGWVLPDHVPVMVLASDAQQVSGWGDAYLAHEADFVVTGTRLIALGTGDEDRFDLERTDNAGEEGCDVTEQGG